MENYSVLYYAKWAIDSLIEDDRFSAGQQFRDTQRDALFAHAQHLNREDLSVEERLRFIFEIAQGIGKTPLELAIIGRIQTLAKQDGHTPKALLIVPTELLMNQTYNKIKQFVPEMLESTGRYGAEHRDLSHDMTIIISDSFMSLIEAGVINPDTYKIIVSDEGHNETSIRRVNNLTSTFEGTTDTLFLTMTATADFDQEKSVELTHGDHRFSRGMVEAIKNGELAKYYRTQLHMLRIMPPTVQQKQAAAANGITRLNHEMRKQAWSNFSVMHYANDVDDQTGRFLRESHAGFYGADTNHADYVAEALNANPILQAQAKEMGLDGVAVSIHYKSGTRPEINRLLDAVIDGAYLAVAMDKMGREGFDWPPMKVLYDWIHVSNLLKRQILGRPDREFLDPRNNFLPTGATAIDVLPYIGSADPEKNQKLRNLALMTAVTAPSVLNQTYVMGPGVTPVSRPVKNEPDYTQLLDFHVESHSTLEAVRTVHAQRQSLIDQAWSKNPLTMSAIKDTLEAYRKDNPCSTPSEIEGMIEHGPLADRMTWFELFATVREGTKGLAADANFLKWSKNKKLQIKSLGARRLFEHFGYITLVTDTILDEIKAEEARTGLGGFALYHKMKKPPAGLSRDVTGRIVTGHSRYPESIYLKRIRSTYKRQPDETRKPVSLYYRKKIRAERDRTKISADSLLKEMINVPEGLQAHAVQTILTEENNVYLSAEQLNAILDTYKELPDRVELSDDDKLCFLLLREIKSIDGTGLFSKIQDVPDGLTKTMTRNIVAGKTDYARPGHRDVITRAFESLPDRNMAPISKLDAEFMSRAREETGLGGTRLLQEMEKIPDRLTRKTATNIIHGNVKRAEVEHVSAIVDTLTIKLP